MALSSNAEERVVQYERHEHTVPDPQKRVAPLSVFVYDIPYFAACGIFPPFHIANEIFASGGSDGGMSPGATWQPFTVSRYDYNALVEHLRSVDLASLKGKVRYTVMQFGFDSQLDDIQDRQAWVEAVCAKHGEAYHRAIQELTIAKRGTRDHVLVIVPLSDDGSVDYDPLFLALGSQPKKSPEVQAILDAAGSGNVIRCIQKHPIRLPSGEEFLVSASLRTDESGSSVSFCTKDEKHLFTASGAEHLLVMYTTPSGMTCQIMLQPPLA